MNTSLQYVKDTIPHTCLKTKKRLDRGNILLRDLKVGAAEREKSFFLM